MSYRANISRFGIVIALFCVDFVTSKSFLKNINAQIEKEHNKNVVLENDNVLAIVVVTRESPYYDRRSKRVVYLDDSSSYYSKPGKKETAEDVQRNDNIIRVEHAEVPKQNFDDLQDRIQPNYLDISSKYPQKPILRGVWRGCGKKAAKTCKKACRGAYKDACEEYKCKKGLKKLFKKECKRRCKDKFI